jgi:hypothetical protein
MDNFDMQTEKRPSNPILWNIATLLVLVGTLALGVLFLDIFISPTPSLNPFPPPPTPTLLQFPTATITPLSLPATWTPSPTVPPSETPTPRPTYTLEPSFTPFFLTPQKNTPTQTEIPTITPTATLTPTPTTTTTLATPTTSPSPTGMPFAATVDYMASTTYHPDAGCNWMGVAGLVVDKNNSPILYLSIRLGGKIGDQPIDFRGLSGTAPTYGQSGFEFVLGNKPIASTQSLWIQLFDQQDIMPLTDKIYLDTVEDCAKNLIMVRFKKVQ